MQTSDKGIELIKQFEGCKLTAYLCPAGVLTIGYGHTGPGVTPNLKISINEAERLLRLDLVRFEAGVAQAVTMPLNQSQFDALVSFTYNLGVGALRGSTLLKVLNTGYYQAAAEQFAKWNKAGGRVLPGLTRRRGAERALFLS